LGAWFASPDSQKAVRPQDTTYLSNICETMDVEESELVGMFCSDDPIQRALAWRMVGDYHGWDNLDSYPMVLGFKDTSRRLEKHGV
jgi:hypothetical protein